MSSRLPPPDDPRALPEEELIRRGRDAVKRGLYAEARELLQEYRDRLFQQARPVSPAVLASYGLALGHTGRLREGIEVARHAVAQARRNPEVSAALARLYLLAGDRRRAVEELERALAISPQSRELTDLRAQLGFRRPPPIPFLPRKSAVNVRLGKALRRRKTDRV